MSSRLEGLTNLKGTSVYTKKTAIFQAVHLHFYWVRLALSGSPKNDHDNMLVQEFGLGGAIWRDHLPEGVTARTGNIRPKISCTAAISSTRLGFEQHLPGNIYKHKCESGVWHPPSCNNACWVGCLRGAFASGTAAHQQKGINTIADECIHTETAIGFHTDGRTHTISIPLFHTKWIQAAPDDLKEGRPSHERGNRTNCIRF
jgi:hypothetical protein